LSDRTCRFRRYRAHPVIDHGAGGQHGRAYGAPDGAGCITEAAGAAGGKGSSGCRWGPTDPATINAASTTHAESASTTRAKNRRGPPTARVPPRRAARAARRATTEAASACSAAMALGTRSGTVVGSVCDETPRTSRWWSGWRSSSMVADMTSPPRRCNPRRRQRTLSSFQDVGRPVGARLFPKRARPVR